MEKSVFILFAIILLLIGLLITYLVYFGQRFLKLQEKKMAEMEKQNSGLTLDELVKSGKISKELAQLHQQSKAEANTVARVCSDHPDIPAYKQCALSGEYLCQNCITKQSDVWVGKKYMDLYLDTNWEELLMISNTEDNKDSIQKIMEKKRGLWEGESLPVIVQGHYKINVENDDIESYMVILVRPEDRERVQRELSIIQ